MHYQLHSFNHGSMKLFHGYLIIMRVVTSFAPLMKSIDGKNTTAIDTKDDDRILKETCQKLKSKCMTLPLTPSQQQTLQTLQNIIVTSFNYKLASVRSSSVEEDGIYSSYAGMYETFIGCYG